MDISKVQFLKTKKWLALSLVFSISIQLMILAAEYLSSVWPLWFGQPVLLQTHPIDPRSLLRGNYIKLNYPISWVKKSLSIDTFKSGEIAYLTLKQDGKVFIAERLQKLQPKKGIYIRGRATPSGNGYQIQYGIEAFFLPKKKALAIEKRLSHQTALAEVYLQSNGKAAIANII